jgi:hypothetical protein
MTFVEEAALKTVGVNLSTSRGSSANSTFAFLKLSMFASEHRLSVDEQNHPLSFPTALALSFAAKGLSSGVDWSESCFGRH